MSVIRAFVAIDLPDTVQLYIRQVQEDLQADLQGLPVRWVPAENIHLTLKFLGDVSENNLIHITNLLVTNAQQRHPFDLGVGSFGVFPNVNRPRVIWVGVEAPEELYNCQRRFETETVKMGYPPDEREFSPHLTLGRVNRNASPQDVRVISEKLRKVSLGFLGVARVDQIHLFRSDLRPDGAVYTKIFSAPLVGE